MMMNFIEEQIRQDQTRESLHSMLLITTHNMGMVFLTEIQLLLAISYCLFLKIDVCINIFQSSKSGSRGPSQQGHYNGFQGAMQHVSNQGQLMGSNNRVFPLPQTSNQQLQLSPRPVIWIKTRSC